MSISPNNPGTQAGFPLYFQSEAGLLASSAANGRTGFAMDTQKLYLRSSGAWAEVGSGGGGGDAGLGDNNTWTGVNTFQNNVDITAPASVISSSGLRVVGSGTPAPLPANTFLSVQSTATSGSSSLLEVVSGAAGESAVLFSDTAETGTGRISFDHNTNTMTLVAGVGAGGFLSLSPAGAAYGLGLPVAGQAMRVISTTGTFNPPTLTTAQRDAISSPADGSQFYNGTAGKFQFRESGAWVEIGTGDAQLAGNNTWTGTNSFQGDVSITSGAIFNVQKSGTPITLNGNAVAGFQNTGTIGSNSFIELVSGTTGTSGIILSDTLGAFRGFIQYANSLEELSLGSNGSQAVRIRASGVTMGNPAPAPVAGEALRVDSTTGVFFPPRMTTAQRDALPAGGLGNGAMVYNTTTDKLQVRAAGAWVDLH